MDRGWGRANWAAFNWLLFLTGEESNRRASDKGWESKRPNEETRGGGRREGEAKEGGTRGERGMKSSEEGKSSTVKPKLPRKRSAPAARSPAAAAPGSPARPRPLRAPAGQGRRAGAGTTNLGRGAARLSGECRGREPHSRGQTAGAKRGERRRRATPALQPRPRREREYFSNDSNFPPCPAFWGLSWLELLS